MKNYKFSIAMTCYNCEKFIKTAISSVLIQTYTNWELVIVDDCSIDNSYKIALEAKKIFYDKDIKVFRRTKNGGYGPCLKDAIEHSSGEIIAIVDADDSIDSEALKIMNEQWNKYPDYAVIYSSSYWCNNNLVPVKKGPSGSIPEGKTLLDCLIHGPKTGRISHLKTFRKLCYDELEYVEIDNLRKRVDKALMIQLEERGKVKYIPDILYFYRDHNSNLTNKYFKLQKEEKDNLDKQWEEIKKRALERRKKRR